MDEIYGSSDEPLDDPTVKILVGPDKLCFEIHKELLCDSSRFFKAAFEGSFKEGEEQVLELPEEDVDIFEQYRLWLYPDESSEDEAPDEPSEDEGPRKPVDIDLLLRIYFFADRRIIPELQNSTIDAIIEKLCFSGQYPQTKLRWIYNETPASSPLRKLFVDFMVEWAHDTDRTSWFNRSRSHVYPREFLVDLAAAYCNRLEEGRPKKDNWRPLETKYHV